MVYRYFMMLLHIGLMTMPAAAAMTYHQCLRGANVAGGEFGEKHLPGVYGRSHKFPSGATFAALAERNINVVRLPFRWERVQQDLFGPLDETEFGHLDEAVRQATSHGLTVILDPHNYGGYHDGKIGTPAVPIEALADLWRRLAPRYADREDVIFLLNNEPEGLTAATWLAAANAAIAAIRETGANNLIMVPGTIWTGASHWFASQEGGSNAQVMTGVADPLGYFVFDFHQYLDRNFSGKDTTCPRTDDAIAALDKVTGWLVDHGFQGFLGEFGGSDSPDCLEGLKQVTAYVDGRGDAWIGWAAWAAGEWWTGYPLSIQPQDPDGPEGPRGLEDTPQMRALLPSFRANSGLACAVQ
ncbi:cellulase [Roseibium aquae]|uniref:Cellulase n=1 Tax=Roseibium aquae TaxID=1323746 RepID=A0A916X1Q8_9HYPH|nr:glycoside hydrolase family 5 protein [Roseibium aquae]GGB48463.1 cellulase [Roseibium aquae]